MSKFYKEQGTYQALSQLFLLLVLLFSTNVLYAQKRIAPKDSVILARFQREMEKAGWPLTWKNQPTALWKGISLIEGTNRVNGVYFSNYSSPVFDGTPRNDSLPACIEILNELDSLNFFYVWDMPARVLPNSLGKLTKITFLYLGACSFTELPSQVGNLIRLESLALTMNSAIRELPASVYTLPHLKGLQVAYCSNFTTISSAISNLKTLKQLRLYSNSIGTLPESIGAMTQLEELDISWNQIAAIPESFSKLTNLTSLSAGHNNLTHLPAGLSKLTKLHAISFGQNKLTDIEFILSSMKGLLAIDFSANQFTALPSALLQPLPSTLSEINLSDNQIQGSIPVAWSSTGSSALKLHLENNFLSGKLEAPILQSAQMLFLEGNKYTLQDVFNMYQAKKNYLVSVLHFTPQRKIGIAKTIKPALHETLSVAIDNFTHLEGSIYTWYRTKANTLDKELYAKTSDPVLTFTHFDPQQDGGIYSCEVTHPKMPGHIEMSSPVYVDLPQPKNESEEIRVIGQDLPPVVTVDTSIRFRQKDSYLFSAEAKDDYTAVKDITWHCPGTTHLQVSFIQESNRMRYTLTPTDTRWSGKDTLLLSAADEFGNTTHTAIAVEVFPAVNTPPVLAYLPPVYLQSEAMACQKPSTCDSVFVYSAVTPLDLFLMDDFDDPRKLSVTLDSSDVARLENRGIFITADHANVFTTAITEKRIVFEDSVSIQATDSEEGIVTGVLRLRCYSTNVFPQLAVLPVQRIPLGTPAFPVVNLSSNLSDDYLPTEYVKVAVSAPSRLNARYEHGKLIVSPTSGAIFIDSVTVYLSEMTNSLMQKAYFVKYEVIPSDYRVSGSITDSLGRTVPGVSLHGFGAPVITDANGFFSAQEPVGWSGTITPVLKDYFFTPASVSISSLQQDATYNFRATLITEVAPSVELSQLILYPNPSNNGNFTIGFEGNRQVYTELNIRIFTMNGLVIYEKTIQAEQSVSLPYKGIFVVEIKSGRALFHRKLVLK